MNEKKFEKMKNITNLRAYELSGVSMLVSMFAYDFGEDIRYTLKEFLEWGFIRFGFSAIAKHNGKYYVGYVSGYEFDEYGLPTGKCSFYTRHGHQFEVTIGENCVIGYNNNIRTPELMIKKFAEMLNETDKSIKVAIKKTRVNPIPLANNSKAAKALEEMMNDIEDGQTKIIMQGGVSAQDLVAQGTPRPAVETVSLTSPEDVTRIQYLSRLHDDLLKRVATFYGHSLSGVNKMAQVNSDELKGYETFAKIYPFIMLEARKNFIEECNSVFGTAWAVDFSPAWEHLAERAETAENNDETEEGVENDVE